MSWIRIIFWLPILLLLCVLSVFCFFKKKEKEFFFKYKEAAPVSEKDKRSFGWSSQRYAKKARKALIGVKGLMILVMLSVVCRIFENKINIAKNSQTEEITQETLSSIFEAAGGIRGIYDPAEVIESEKEKTEEVIKDIVKNSLFFSWYEKAPGDMGQKKDYYRNNVADLIESGEEQPFIEKAIAQTEENETIVYNKNIEELDRIEAKKVPEGYKREDVEMGAVSPLQLDADTYLWEYEMRWQCYIIKSSASMLQQLARAAMDYTVVSSENIRNMADIIKYAGYAVTHYLCLMRLEDVEESKADCCYWIAKAFYILADNLPEDFKEFIEHCKLMSLAFCELGVSYLDTSGEENDHGNDLKRLRDEIDARII